MSASPTSAPAISVVVPARKGGTLRLRWLLAALEEQSLPRGRFEVLVCHAADDLATAELVEHHSLAGTARALAAAPGALTVGAARNLGWRAARAPLIALTTADCRPPPGWLEAAVSLAGAHPGALVKGVVEPDPDELMLGSPRPRAEPIDSSRPWAEASNVVVTRELLERLGGLREDAPALADAELLARARGHGTPALIAPALIAPALIAPDLVVFRGLDGRGLRAALRGARLSGSVPWLIGCQPNLRGHLLARLWWRESHAWLLLALVGIGAARRPLPRAAALVPWALRAAPRYGPGPRRRLRAVLELPGEALLDGYELALLIAGSIRWRTLVL